MPKIPENLGRLHAAEELLRANSVAIVEAHDQLLLHMEHVEQAMNLLDGFRQLPTTDEDIKVVQMLCLRVFNAFGSATKLVMSGYYLFGGQIMRDVLETLFLLDHFRSSPSAIAQWRLASPSERMKAFRPVKVRTELDSRDGFSNNRRAKMYELLSELSGHPTMASVAMLKPKGHDAQNAPFVDPTAITAALSELGRLAAQVGGPVLVFMTQFRDRFSFENEADQVAAILWFTEVAEAYMACARRWREEFYPAATPSANL